MSLNGTMISYLLIMNHIIFCCYRLTHHRLFALSFKSRFVFLQEKLIAKEGEKLPTFLDLILFVSASSAHQRFRLVIEPVFPESACKFRMITSQVRQHGFTIYEIRNHWIGKQKKSKFTLQE